MSEFDSCTSKTGNHILKQTVPLLMRVILDEQL